MNTVSFVLLLLGLLVGVAVGAYVAWQASRSTIEALQGQIGQREAERDIDSRLLAEIAPVKETLLQMGSTVAELEKQRAAQHAALEQQLSFTRTTAEQSRTAAESLAAALSNNTVRGVWGETQLRSLVESAGLLHRVDFDTQAAMTAESGARRPDMVVHLPGGKSLVIDAKVPYSAYLEASSLRLGEDEALRGQLLSQHAKQVRGHVDALAKKQYWTGLEASPEFTIAFIPNEPLLAAALAADPTLLEDAFAKKIALASPVSLWAVLKTVAFTWQQEVLTDDAKALFDLGQELYGRIATLAQHADKLRKSIESTVSAYNGFAGSLESRVLVTARKLNALDESKLIAEPPLIQAQPQLLTQPELTT
jgi:DNA recombination protein RmuC